MSYIELLKIKPSELTEAQKKELTFYSANDDICQAWDKPLHRRDRVNRTWIYAVDPETMDYAKMVWKLMSGDKSLYQAFCLIRKCSSRNEMVNELAEQYGKKYSH